MFNLKTISLLPIHGTSPLSVFFSTHSSSREHAGHKLNSSCHSGMRRCVKEGYAYSLGNKNLSIKSPDGSNSGEEFSGNSYNKSIQYCCKLGDIDEAMALLAQMQALGFHPSSISYASLIEALASVGRTLEADAIFQEMVCFGFNPKLRFYNILLRGFLKKGLLGLGSRLLMVMEDMGICRNQETYEILLDYHVNAGRLDDTWLIINEMRSKGFQLNSFVYGKVIGLYRDNGMWKKAVGIVEEIREMGLSLDRQIYNSIIDTFGKYGELVEALEVFEKMRQESIRPDIVTWNSLIRWHCKAGDVAKALELFTQMQEQGFYPDPKIFITIISCLGELGKWDVIKKNFENMKDRGHGKIGAIYAILVDIYGQYGRFRDPEECIAALKLEGLQPSGSMFCILANAYAQQGLCEQTVKVLQLMEPEGIEPNLVMLNVLINAFGVAGKYKEALSVYHLMKDIGISPDLVTYSTLMKAFIRAKKFHKVPEIYKQMESSGCTPVDRERATITYSQYFEHLPYGRKHKESVVSILQQREIKASQTRGKTSRHKTSYPSGMSQYFYTRSLCAAKVGSSAWPCLHTLTVSGNHMGDENRSFRPRQFEYHPSISCLMVFGTLDGEIVVVNHENENIVSYIPSFGAMNSVLGLCWLKKYPSKLIAGSDNGSLKLYDIRHMPPSIRGMHYGAGTVTFDEFDQLTSVHVNSTDELFLASGYSKNIALYDINSGRRLQVFADMHKEHINVVKFSNHSPSIFATSSFDQDVKLWDLRQKPIQPCYTASSSKGNVMVCFSPDDHYLLVSAVDNEVRQLLAVDGRVHLNFGITATGSSQNYTRSYYLNGRDYIVSGSCDEHVVRICCAQTGRRLRDISLEGKGSGTSMFVQSLRGDPFRDFNMSILAAYTRPSSKSEIVKVNLLASTDHCDKECSHGQHSRPSRSMGG